MIDYVMLEVSNKLSTWKLIDNISNGWVGIESNISNFIPKEDGEQDKSYNNRVTKLTHFDYFNNTIGGIVGLIFKNRIKLSEDTPSQILDLIEDIDLQGTHLDNFIANSFKSALQKGVSFTLVDLPKVEELKNKADEINQNIRPYLIDIAPENVTAWKTSKINNKTVLTMVKIREFQTIDDDKNPYATISKEVFRVLKIGTWELWELDENKKEILIDSGTTNLDYIPFYCLNLAKEDTFLSKLPFLDLAKLNIAHTQIFTDTRHSAHIASVPMLKLLGIQQNELNDFVVSANKAITSTNQDAKVDWLDYDGKGVSVNDTLMLKIEKRMGEIGLNVLAGGNNNGDVTATEIRISTTKEQSKITKWVNNLSDTYNNILLALAGAYGLNYGGSIEIEADIIKEPLTPQEIQAYSSMVSNGQMSIETLWQTLKTHKNLPDDFDSEVEKEKIATDGLLTSNE
jgi:hypothetical protein